MVKLLVPVTRKRYLPRKVEPWMIYTNGDTMRAHCLRAGYSDRVGEYTISWDLDRAEYSVRTEGKGKQQHFSRVADAYAFMRRGGGKRLELVS